jgi:hypothetical protein
MEGGKRWTAALAVFLFAPIMLQRVWSRLTHRDTSDPRLEWPLTD